MADPQVFSVAGLVAPHPVAAAAGRDVLVEGGTVIEAALAAAMVAAVVAPDRNGLGGDALWLVREPGPRGRVRVLDARGTTGRLATAARLRGLGRDRVPDHGAEAALVAPGAASGWAEAHALAQALGGRLPLRRLLEPAIAAARDGFAAPLFDDAALAAAAARGGEPGFAATFPDEARPPAAGVPWRCPALAATLDHLAHAGLDDLVRGDVARELALDLDRAGCPLGRDDLGSAGARWRTPATLDLGSASVAVAVSGAAVAAATALGLFASLGPAVAPESFGGWHGLIESLSLAPALVAGAASEPGGIAALLDRHRLARAAQRISRTRAAEPVSAAPRFPEDGVVVAAADRDGAAVALVQTLGSAWGSGVVSGRTGILLGNRGAALALDRAAGAELGPGRRVPLLATPMLLSERSGRVASLAATGPQAGALACQAAARLLAGTTDIAVAAPRFGLGPAPDGPPAVLVEADREPEPAARLRAAGHGLADAAPGELRTLGLVARLPSGRVEAASDAGEAFVAGL